MAKPKKKQIEQEIKELTEIMPKVRHFSTFGDDNRKAIEVQIDVLKDNLSWDQIDYRWLVDPELISAQSLWESACEARTWLDGESDEESLVEGWRPLIEKSRDGAPPTH